MLTAHTVRCVRMEKRVPIHTSHGTFDVFTKRAGRHPRIKVLCLHGGPAATHEYLAPLEELDAELVFYDQLGSANSAQPEDDRLWTLERFIDEVEQVRAAYELDDFFLYGHSWGGILAIEYALAHGRRLKGLIVSNVLSSVADHNREVDALVAQTGLPPDHPELVSRILAEHMCRLPVWPAPVTNAFAKMNRRISVLLRGESQLSIGGRLATWERKADLHRITMPTLVIGARYDLGADLMREMAEALPRGSFALCPEGSHLCMWDDRAAYVRHVQEFLDRVAS